MRLIDFMPIQQPLFCGVKILHSTPYADEPNSAECFTFEISPRIPSGVHWCPVSRKNQYELDIPIKTTAPSETADKLDAISAPEGHPVSNPFVYASAEEKLLNYFYPKLDPPPMSSGRRLKERQAQINVQTEACLSLVNDANIPNKLKDRLVNVIQYYLTQTKIAIQDEVMVDDLGENEDKIRQQGYGDEVVQAWQEALRQEPRESHAIHPYIAQGISLTFQVPKTGI